MKTCIFIKSWLQDIPWLKYSLSFLEKNWQDPQTEVVIVADPDCRAFFQGFRMSQRERLFFVKPWPDGYCHAMWVKSNADNFTSAELIIFFDSDTMLLEPAIAETFMDDGKPIICYIDYPKFNEIYPHAPWYKTTERLMGLKPRYYHTYLPFACWRDTLRAARVHVARRHRWSVESIAYSDKPFHPDNFEHHPMSWADHEIIGAYAHEFEPELYYFQKVGSEGSEPNVPWRTKQYHSWSQWNRQTEAELKTLLARDHVNHVPAAPDTVSADLAERSQ